MGECADTSTRGPSKAIYVPKYRANRIIMVGVGGDPGRTYFCDFSNIQQYITLYLHNWPNGCLIENSTNCIVIKSNFIKWTYKQYEHVYVPIVYLDI